MPALSFYYDNSETCEPYIYTQKKGSDTDFDSIVLGASWKLQKSRGRQ